MDLHVFGVPTAWRGGHFGYSLGAWFAPPFEPSSKRRVLLHLDLPVQHPGVRRTAAFNGLVAQARERNPSRTVALFDPVARMLRFDVDPELRQPLRRRVVRRTGGQLGLRCLPVDLVVAKGDAAPEVGAFVELTGRFSDPLAPQRFLVEDYSIVSPQLALRQGSGNARAPCRGRSAPTCAVFVAAADSFAVLPGHGPFLIGAPGLIATGFTKATGFAKAPGFTKGIGSWSMSIDGFEGRNPWIQAVVFSAAGEVVTTRCVCAK